MDSQQIALVFVGAVAGGLVNGLTGFGTGLTVLGIWLYAISPTVAATLVIFCSCISQLQTLPMIWPSIRWNYALAFVVPGLLGVPIGTLLLPHIDPRLFKIGVGVFLVAYTGYVLARRAEFKSPWGGIAADSAIGFAGGILGGLAGLSGVLLVVWTDIRGWSKEHRRGVIQVFNIAILMLALASHVVSGLFTRQVAMAAIAALPGTIGGVWLGGFIYRRIADRSYSRVIMVLLLIAGVALIFTSR
ncbi:MAG TPA: sulfite exporter TauE/SafE family protein [Xanthobacteraceae bacterium]|jgi:hypothetical protein|nr:sulfite exporter TauE/SafE family protein [Xanthobacteraceae bacterium]